MATLNADQLATIGKQAGFAGNDLVWFISTALAESGGRTDATNNIGAGHTGIMQISGVHLGAHPTWTRAWLMNPQNNASAARTLFLQYGKRPWLASSGRRLLYAKTAEDAAKRAGTAGVDPTTIGGAAGLPDLSPSNPLASAQQALSLAAKAGTWISDPRNWMRIVYVALGGALVVGALVMVAMPVATSVATPVVKTAVKAAKG